MPEISVKKQTKKRITLVKLAINDESRDGEPVTYNDALEYLLTHDGCAMDKVRDTLDDMDVLDR